MVKDDEVKSIEDSINRFLNKKSSSGKRVNSIRKGKSFERDCAKMLTEALGVSIVRIPQSGAFSTVHLTPIWAGDLMCSDPDTVMPFVFEAKFHRETDLHHLMSSKNPKISEWTEQALKEAGHTGKVPVILYKYNRSNAVFAVARKDDMAKYLKEKEKAILFLRKGTVWFVTTFENVDWKSAYSELSQKIPR